MATDRLTFSRPTAGDVELIYSRYASDPEVTRFLVWPTHQSLDDTRAFLAFSDAEWTRGPAGPLLIWLREDGRLVGGTGLACGERSSAGTGYVLAQDMWGRGLATETLSAMVTLAARLGITALDAGCHPDHVASRRVLEKCGFTVDPHFQGTTTFPNLDAATPQPVLRYVRSVDPDSRRPSADRQPQTGDRQRD